MNTKTIALACAAAICGAAFADEEKAEGWTYTPGEGVSFDEQPIVSAEASLAFDSKYLSYGFVDNKDVVQLFRYCSGENVTISGVPYLAE